MSISVYDAILTLVDRRGYVIAIWDYENERCSVLYISR